MKINSRAIEKIIRSAANHVGIDVKRYKDASSESACVVKMLHQHKIDLVIDIGANRGQYAQLLRRYGYQGRIISFEPLQDAWDYLQKISSNDSKWEIFPRCAIGASNSFTTINVSGNSVSSSILDMLDQHAKAAPESVYVREEAIQVITLDEALEKISVATEKMFIKIDTQGYEEKVLDGARVSASLATGIQIELSLIPLYSGQALFQELTERLIQDEFEIWSIFPGFTDGINGRMLQCDAVLFKTE